MPKKKTTIRKPNFRYGGVSVTICGHRLPTDSDLVCTFHYAHFPTHIHGTIALSDKGEVYVVVDIIGKGVEAWRLVGPQE